MITVQNLLYRIFPDLGREKEGFFQNNRVLEHF
jgi:hypothetical protein